jgi:lycopene beta-cyclase
MTIPLTYAGVHAVFILPPILILGWLAFRRDNAWWGVRPLSGLAIMIGLAVVYTTPWTNHLIPNGVWWYGDGVVLATIWHTPIEEYLFFVLQPMLTAFWLFQLPAVVDRPLAIPTAHRVIGAIGGVTIAGIGWLLTDGLSTYYLGWLLVWAGPILAVQWAFGLTSLWAVRRRLAIALAVPTAYLWLVDRIAIELGVWTISDTYTTGYALGGLPIEEMLFFFVTNLFVVQGIVLYIWVLDTVDARPTFANARRRFGANSTEQ